MEYEFDKDGNLISATHPKYLFKYTSISEYLYSMLSENYLWFSSISDFNDPFECYTLIDNEVTDDEFLQYFEYLSNNVLPKSFLQKLQETTGSSHDFILKNREKIKSMMTDDFMTKVLHMPVKNIGICCFSEEKSSVLMWAHYANNFKGVCLVYDFKELVDLAPVVPIKVRYLEDVPNFNFIRHRLKQLQKAPNGELGENDTEYDKIVLGTKKIEWAYEKEYRLMSYYQGKVPIRPTSLKGIIFGNRVSDKLKKKTQETVKKYHPQIEFTTLAIDQNQKKISIEKFDNEKITRHDVVMADVREVMKKFQRPY